MGVTDEEVRLHFIHRVLLRRYLKRVLETVT